MMAPRFTFMRSRMVLNMVLMGVIVPLAAVGLSSYFGDSEEEKERKIGAQVEERLHRGSPGKDISTMHDFIRSQAGNKDADFSELLGAGRGKFKRQNRTDD